MEWFAGSESCRLDLGEGQWIEVKQELSYGDMQRVAQDSRANYSLAEQCLVAAYLLDWSLMYLGKPVPIEEHVAKMRALAALTVDTFTRLSKVISEHAEAQSKKKAPTPPGKKGRARTSASAA